MTIIGKNTLTGSAAALNTDAVLMLTKGTLAPVLPANQELVSMHFGYGDVAGTGTTTINAALYDITSGVASAPKISGTEVAFVMDNTALSGNQWIDVTGLNVDLSAHSGKTLAILVTSPDVDGAGVVVETSAGSTRSRSSAASTALPATFTEASTSTSIFSLYGVTRDIAAAGPTITGPDSTTEGAVTVQTGTLQDTVVTQSLISGSYSIEQTIDSATATTLNYVAESGVNQCTPSTPVSGVPLEPTITAAGITPYVVQQKSDDGTNPPATRNITLNPEATYEVIQTMAGVANTTPDQSIFGTNIIIVEDDMQAYVPKTANGMTITWADDGTFSTGMVDQTEVIDVAFFSPATGQWSCIALTIKDTSIISVSEGYSNTDAINFFVAQTGTNSRQFNQAAIAYYKSVTSSNSNQFNVLLKAAQEAVGFVGHWPGDRGN